MKYFKETVDFLDESSFNDSCSKISIKEQVENNKNLKDIISSLANK